ncbi:hypothetical protein LAZ67_23001281 [Cordylochernes scorpioides]|uniref:Integrase catalytic domain-containing protein n=1 Tax=Cordylochernes scorpioides TaxID=51811 RepID=A0ABY6LQZ6_9ARAC|nr:hypothetical protein LAZ67_23001281 [Cordylochernes scorpioides]
MELCASLLLAQLTKLVCTAMSLNINKVILWSDSTIVLSWLASEHSRWKSYVSNQVKDIQELLTCRWMHVKGEDNPADLASRGISSDKLPDLELWWHGPPWLKTTSQPYNASIPVINEQCLSEQRIKTNLFVKRNISYSFITRYSSLNKLKRITGWIFRFFYNCRKPLKKEKSGALSLEEIETSFNRIIRCAQQEDYYIDLRKLEALQPINGKSPLIKLNAFLDKCGLFRVGGRLNNAFLSFDQKKHIILLNYHQRKYWIPSGRCLVKQIMFKCIKGARFRTKAVQQLMGNLPTSRINWTRPFTKTGIDFAGPVIVKTSNLRNARCDKAYIALFICMFSKAIHIELVTNLTTEAFLAALRRFIARRGRPAEINTDNATNFVEERAYKDFRKLFNSNIHDFASSEEIKWNFIPPYSPHFGGLWEAGIKSVKYHLLRIAEARLNSRSLCPLTDDPEDLPALTAGHFLIGMPLTSVPYNRSKWLKPVDNIKIGTLVLLKEDNLPLFNWRMGRINQVYPGEDGLVRVVSVKTADGDLRRAVAKEGTTDRRDRSHPPQCTTSCADRQIVRMAVTDRSVTSRTVAQHIQSVTHPPVSARTIRSRLQHSGLSARRPLLRLPLTQNHRRLRRQWCDERRMWTAEWNEIVFTDEYASVYNTTIVDSSLETPWREDAEQLRYAPPHCQRYISEVLEPVVLPCLQGLPTAIFQQDNARPHEAWMVQRFFGNRQIELLPWQGRSPELSPIENMWSMVAQRLNQITSPAATPDQLWKSVEAAWPTVLQEHIQSPFESMPRRVAAVISNNGGYFGY